MNDRYQFFNRDRRKEDDLLILSNSDLFCDTRRLCIFASATDKTQMGSSLVKTLARAFADAGKTQSVTSP